MVDRAQSWNGHCDPDPAQQQWAALQLQLHNSTFQHDIEIVIFTS